MQIILKENAERQILLLPRNKLILENSIHRPLLETNSDSSASMVLNMAYVEAVIQAQYAIGNLRAAEKDGDRYYSIVDSH